MSTYSSLHFHIIFGTKNRRPWMTPDIAIRIHEYTGGVVRGLGGFPQGIGGVADHLHLLVGLKPIHKISDFMRELKKQTSHWIQDEVGVDDFSWQQGYGVFSVSPPSRNSVMTYIANQPEHHRTLSFKDEFRELLERAGIDFDPKYLV